MAEPKKKRSRPRFTGPRKRLRVLLGEGEEGTGKLSRAPKDARGTVQERTCGLVDLVPTFLSAADLPADARLAGYDLLGPEATMGSFSELHGSGYHETEKAPAVMWRTPEWKLILYLPGEFRNLDARLDAFKGELYCLKDDPMECRNLYETAAHLPIREKLTRHLLLHMSIAWSRFPRPYSYTDIH